MLVFVLAVVLVFLVLAAQYESWSLPLAVILVVPMCLLCSIAGVLLAQMDINIFTQVGFVVLVGLACKNAILIVEFAKASREAGVDRYRGDARGVQAAAAADHDDLVRLHPRRGAAGASPKGAGAEMRRTLGTAVFAGMLGVTLFGIFLTPVFYYVIQWFADRRMATQPRLTRSSRTTAADGSAHRGRIRPRRPRLTRSARPHRKRMNAPCGSCSGRAGYYRPLRGGHSNRPTGLNGSRVGDYFRPLGVAFSLMSAPGW